jgi:phosphate transport system permease protein
MAVPVGVLGGLYVSERANTPVGLAVRFGTDVLAGLPSIVVGLFVHTVMVAGIGYSALSGAVALAIMMLPVVLRATEEMLKLVPRALYEASAGLGAPVWKTSLHIMLPAAMRGVVTGVLLAVSRVSGETAPLLFTAQGNNVMSTALDQPIATLPLTMFKYASDPDPARNTQAWGIALLIVVLVLGLNVLSRVILGRSKS